MARILLISNGHGEDISGSLIGEALRKEYHNVEAMPLVGIGSAYQSKGIKVITKVRDFSTGGLGYTSIKGRLTEILEGQFFYLLKKLIDLIWLAKKYDLLIAVGDVIPVFSAWLTRCKFTTYLVAYSSHYEGKLKLPWPCKQCLESKNSLEVYTRDKLTAEDLTKQLNKVVKFLGNPFMDPLFETKKNPSTKIQRLGLIPGSRIPELEKNLLLMLSMIKLLPSSLNVNNSIQIELALVKSLTNQRLEKLIRRYGLEKYEYNEIDNTFYISCGHFNIKIRRDSFAEILQNSDVLICMAGTAAEQAVGLGKPVIQLPGEGPQFTKSFAEAQRRLLGPSVFCAKGNSSNPYYLLESAKITVDIMNRIRDDLTFQQICKEEAKKRLGEAGGSKRISHSISNIIKT